MSTKTSKLILGPEQTRQLYGLDMKCSPETHELKAWSPVGGAIKR
jgi:hypothetical protein